MFRKRLALTTVTAAVSLFTFAQAATAANFCVGPAVGCSGPSYAADAAGITQAVNAAAGQSGDDVVHVAAGTYAINDNTFPLASPGDRLDIVGAGPGQTVFNGTSGGYGLIHLQLPTAASELRGFSLNAVIPGNHHPGMQLTRGSVRDFEISLTGAGGGNVAAVFDEFGNELSDGVVATITAQAGYTNHFGSPVLKNVAFASSSSAYPAMRFGGSSDATVSGVSASGYLIGLHQENGTVDVTDSLINMKSTPNAVGLFVRDQNTASNSTINFTGERLTIVGTGANQTGLLTGTGSAADAGDSMNWSLRDSVIYGSNLAASAVCHGPLSFGFYGVIASNVAPSFPTGGCSNNAPTSVSVDATAFQNFGVGIFTPVWNGDLIDAGTTNPNPSGTTDYNGRPRVVDGDNSGTATADIGAIEYQRGAPTVTLETPKLTLSPLEATTFTAVAEDPENEDITLAWTFDGIASPLAAAEHPGGFITPGAHTVAVTATDEAGASSSAQVVVQVVSPTSPVADPPICTSISTDRVKVVARAKKSFKRGSRAFYLAGREAKQPYFTLEPSFPAGEATVSLQLTLESVSKKGKRKLLKGAQVIKVKHGTTKFGFGGRWNKKKLKAGRYKVNVLPLVSGGVCRAAEARSLQIRLK